MYTEKEAKEKGCPLMMLGMMINPDTAKHPELVCCNTSECMMWRFDGFANSYKQGQPVKGTQTGYCGLTK